ncbi:hypothetical protein D4Z93_10850 [Clostridium fermenticellae]|uniref:Uncharacterized protein n=1 Tax=Clostridium fermenticellae TaxID=2068654 RepID=A0A386H5K3_9CLOT|nr:hypothetical protein [Clostridium fermenticellae]AYD40992.1 hypothetical protein D4Z93_10850 [Clostridium fermenticellae]
MKRKIKGVALIIFVCIFIIIYGFIVVNGRLPKFIKDRSYVQINYNFRPFNFTVSVGEYSFYINRKIITNLKYGSEKVMKGIHEGADSITEKASEKTKEVFNKLGIK